MILQLLKNKLVAWSSKQTVVRFLGKDKKMHTGEYIFTIDNAHRDKSIIDPSRACSCAERTLRFRKRTWRIYSPYLIRVKSVQGKAFYFETLPTSMVLF